MSMLCILAAGATIALPLPAFTLAWTHSIEKIRWEEDYRVSPQGLMLMEARVRGTGAGMEIPDGAILRNGTWHYRPALPALPALRLTRSPFVPDYELCTAGTCRPLGEAIAPAKAEVVDLTPCPPSVAN